jgi:hypothetical protein
LTPSHEPAGIFYYYYLLYATSDQFPSSVSEAWGSLRTSLTIVQRALSSQPW